MTDTVRIFDTPMGWWYWFGAWIGLALSIVLIWWAFLDAYRSGKRSGHMFQRMTWPFVSLIGFVLQIPALIILMIGDSTGRLATPLAALGLCGAIFVGITMIAFFSRSIATGNTIFSRTKNIDSSTTTGTRARENRGGGGVAVPIPGDRRGSGRTQSGRTASAEPTPLPKQEGTPAHLVPTARTASSTAPTVASAPKKSKRTSPPAARRSRETSGTLLEEDAARSKTTDTQMTAIDEPEENTIITTERTLVEEDHEPEATVIEDDGSGNATVLDEATATITEEGGTVVDEGGNSTVVDEGDSSTVVDEDSSSTVVDDATSDTLVEETIADETAATVYEEPEAEDSALSVQLQLLNDNNRFITLRPRFGSFIVGRDSHQCSLAVSDSKTSRRHFAIDEINQGSAWMLTDLGSSNGTFVNGQRVQGETPLAPGDYIEFGRNRARFIVKDNDEENA